MRLTFMKSKLHRVTVTEADLSYEGSISLCPDLIRESGLFVNEKVDIYNCNNGARFSTYVIQGRPSEVCLNGAAARLVQKGDILIIVSYCELEADEVATHQPQVVFVDSKNRIKNVRPEEAYRRDE